MPGKAIVDIAAYFARIGYVGPREANLRTLNAIVAAHVRAIPFENLDVLLGRPISLDPQRVAHKLLAERRGGYCFEQNTLLLHVLASLGFRVTPLSARVRVQRPREFQPPRTHMFLRVELDSAPGGATSPESWLVDVGIGGFSLTSALRLAADVEQSTPHEPRRIVREGGWSGFERRAPLIAARATAGGRVTLSNRELTLRSTCGQSETRLIETPAELLVVLAKHFGLFFPAGTSFPCSGLDWPTRA